MSTNKIPVDTTRFSGTDAILSAVGATLLIVTEMLGAVFAFAWAIGGLLGIGDTATYVLMAAVGVPGVLASLSLTRRILRVETHLRKAPPQA
ncbi:hypothetical protein [Chthonobacter rhizosphaerae]|uniref:hypothetical protein n=1 Tax=Chthonobacter rhizosphaerae TaxID=2735553 RepID=UPI0015EF5154|nr:hypothetical protein [Chthonobacter rhizosphaerae]